MAKIKKVVENNPTDPDELNRMEDDGTRYRVLHGGVGRHAEGTVVSARDLGPGADIHRLLTLGAVVRLTPEEVAALPESPFEAEEEVSGGFAPPRATTGSDSGPAPTEATGEGSGSAPGTTDMTQVRAPEVQQSAEGEEKPGMFGSRKRH